MEAFAPCPPSRTLSPHLPLSLSLTLSLTLSRTLILPLLTAPNPSTVRAAFRRRPLPGYRCVTV